MNRASTTQVTKDAIKAFITGVLVCTLLALVLVVPALANYATGATSQVTLNGITYYAENYIFTYQAKSSGIKYAKAFVSIWRPGNLVIPAGYAGAYPRLFNDSGSLIGEGPWFYSATGSKLLNECYVQAYASGARVSNGIQKAWTGSQYYSYGMFTSPASSLYDIF